MKKILGNLDTFKQILFLFVHKKKLPHILYNFIANLRFSNMNNTKTYYLKIVFPIKTKLQKKFQTKFQKK